MGTRVQRHVSRTSKVELGKSEKMDKFMKKQANKISILLQKNN